MPPATRHRKAQHDDTAATNNAFTKKTTTTTVKGTESVKDNPRNRQQRRQIKESDQTIVDNDLKSMTQQELETEPYSSVIHNLDNSNNDDNEKSLNRDDESNINKENYESNHATSGVQRGSRNYEITKSKQQPQQNQKQHHRDSSTKHSNTDNVISYDKNVIQKARHQLINSLVDSRRKERDSNEVNPEQRQQSESEIGPSHDFSLRTRNENPFHLKIISFLSLFTLSSNKKLMFDMICYHFDKSHARQFFANLLDVVVYAIQFEIDTDDDTNDDRNRSSTSVEDPATMHIDHEDNTNNDITNRTAVHKKDAITFMLLATEAVQTYLKGMKERQKQKEADQKLRRNSYVVDDNKPLMVSVEVYDVAFQLHNALACITNCLSDQKSDNKDNSLLMLQQSIIELCETWWLCNGNQREYLIVNALPLLVQAALDLESDNGNTNSNIAQSKRSNKSTSATAAVGIIKRLYKIRTAINAIDFTDEDSNVFCTLLQRLVSLPVCLNSTEGKRLLSFLLSNDVILIQKIHVAIRVQIPNNLRLIILKAYGDIYYDAWKATNRDNDDDGSQQNIDAEDDDDNDSSSEEESSRSSIRSKFESIVLQDYMSAVIYAANPSIVKSLTTLLESFYSNKKNNDVENMLYRMYNPIIWRSLKATNAIVRMNATNVFTELFPLVQHPTPLLTKEDNNKKKADQTQLKSSMMLLEDAIIQGCHAIQEIMLDKDHRVRSCGAQSMAKILVTFWDVVPSDQIRRFFNHLLDLSSDASSPAVRVSALNAVTLLLEAKSAHAVLRSMLPKFGNLIHDKNEKVRSACVRMLIRIKKVNGIKYYDVVPVTHLTARLAAEGQRNTSNSVASLITNLMLNSYLPQKGDSAQQLQRTVKFLLSDPAAARVFYANIYKHISLVGVSKLAAMLLRCLHSSVEMEQKESKKGSKRQRSDSIQSQVSKTDVPTLSVSCLANMSEIICILWQSIEKQLIHNEKCNQFLLDEFSGPMLTKVLSHYENKATLCDVTSNEDERNTASMKDDCYRICASVLRCAGRLPSKSVQGLVSYIASVFKTLSKDGLAINSPNVTSHTALLCLWGMSSEVAATLATSIQAAFENEHELLFASPAIDSKKRKSGRNKTSLSTSSSSDIISRAKDDQNDMALIKLPILQPTIALKILSDILAGGDPSSVAARDALLISSKDACHLIEDALTRGTKHAEKLLAADLTYSYSVRESDANFAVNVCECYGRFVLHKEASVHKGLDFTENAEHLLHWTTQKILPAFSTPTTSSTTPNTKNDGETTIVDPFNDLNISSIAVEQSFLGAYSPVATGPPKRRSNFNRTPLKMGNDDSSLRNNTNRLRENEAARYMSRAVAVSLLYSSCLLYSEWLALGCAGAQIISKSALEWGGVFHSMDASDADVQEEIKVLFPSFLRLATYLIISASDSSLLHLLMVKFHDYNNNNNFLPQFKKCLAVLLTSHPSVQNTSPTSIVVACILNVAHEVSDQSMQMNQLSSEATDILTEESTNTDEESTNADEENKQEDQALPMTFHQLIHDTSIDEHSCSLRTMWEITINHRWGCVAMCQLLLDKLDKSFREQKQGDLSTSSNTGPSTLAQRTTKSTLVYCECLRILIHNVTTSRLNAKKVAILRKEVFHLVRQQFQSWESSKLSIILNISSLNISNESNDIEAHQFRNESSELNNKKETTTDAADDDNKHYRHVMQCIQKIRRIISIKQNSNINS